MAAPAKELTKNANLSSVGPRTTFTDPVQTARVFLDALGRLGYDKSALLSAAGLDFSKSADPDVRVPCQVLAAMFGYAMRTRPLKNFGMKLAVETPIGAFPQTVEALQLRPEGATRFAGCCRRTSWRLRCCND